MCECMFPIGDDNSCVQITPFVAFVLISSNVLVFLYEVSLDNDIQAFIMQWGEISIEILACNDSITLLTSMVFV